MAGGAALIRGEVWWGRFPPPDKIRPVVLVTRQEGITHRQLVTVASVTTRIRGIRSEVLLGAAEGLPRVSVANCDDIRTIRKSRLIEQAGSLGDAKLRELDGALRYALGLD